MPTLSHYLWGGELYTIIEHMYTVVSWAETAGRAKVANFWQTLQISIRIPTSSCTSWTGEITAPKLSQN